MDKATSKLLKLVHTCWDGLGLEWTILASQPQRGSATLPLALTATRLLGKFTLMDP